MFKPATTGPKKAITANRLGDGLVVFLDADGGWSVDIAAARLLDEGADFDEALAYGQAQHDARVVVEPYAIDVEVDGNVPVPVRLREEEDFAFDLAVFDQVVSDCTRLIILNSPSNPTGGVLSTPVLEHIADAANVTTPGCFLTKSMPASRSTACQRPVSSLCPVCASAR